MAGGSSHIATMPVIRIDGDRAVALCHGQLMPFHKKADALCIWRSTSVRLEFRRTGDGRKIHRRANQLRDGRQQSHQHFRDSLRSIGAIPGEDAAK
jgi:hypothetical protein